MRPRAAMFEWAHRAAAGTLGQDWVEVGGTREDPPFSLVLRDGALRFRHVPYAAFLPALMAEAAREAREAGEPGLLELLERMLARLEWLVATRQLLWTPLSAAPEGLAPLLEAMGIDPEVHQEDPEFMARAAALLPAWRQARGTLQAALRLLSHAPLPAVSAPAQPASDAPAGPALADEVLVCRDERWWSARQEGAAPPELRISGEHVRFQPASQPWGALPEDVLVSWLPEEPLPQALLRLLPAWTSLRLCLRSPIP